MVLNIIFILFFVLSFFGGIYQLVSSGDPEPLNKMVSSIFSSSETAFELSIGLTGILTFWMGVMKVGEEAGIVKYLSKVISPFFKALFPRLRKDHPAYFPITMNIAANMLNLDNAATPMGLKAMEEMQKDNPKKTVASDPQIMFMVLTSTGLTILPISIMAFRAKAGSANPADVFVPLLIATAASTLAGLLTVATFQRINLLKRTVLLYLGAIAALIVGTILFFRALDPPQMKFYSNIISSTILLGLISLFFILAVFKKVNVYNSFIDGAKGGFKIAITIIPYLVAILVAIGVFRASGGLEYVTNAIGGFLSLLGAPVEIKDALPTAIIKPFSGGGARGFMVDAMEQYGADSMIGRMSAVFQGSTETTFYVLAVYFGAIGVKNTRYALTCGLLADLVGIITAIFVCYLFFG